MKKWLVFASMLTLALVIAACGANSDNSKETSGNAGANTSAEASGSEVVINAKNYEFDQKEYKIKAGETVDLTVKSSSGVHGVDILKTDYKIGNNKTVAVKFDEAGTYDIICNVPCGTGHGLMRAKLVVE